MLKRQKGFTLSELLVSLAVLGLIAAISIPSVYNSVKTQREKAVWKETISVLMNALYEGGMTGELTISNTHQYLVNKLQTKQSCTSDILTEGCWDYHRMGTVDYYTTFDGLITINNVHIVGIRSSQVSGQDRDYCVVDINGVEGPNQFGRDQIELNLIIGIDGKYTVEPRNSLGGTASSTLFYEIFGGV